MSKNCFSEMSFLVYHQIFRKDFLTPPYWGTLICAMSLNYLSLEVERYKIVYKFLVSFISVMLGLFTANRCHCFWLNQADIIYTLQTKSRCETCEGLRSYKKKGKWTVLGPLHGSRILSLVPCSECVVKESSDRKARNEK